MVCDVTELAQKRKEHRRYHLGLDRSNIDCDDVDMINARYILGCIFGIHGKAFSQTQIEKILVEIDGSTKLYNVQQDTVNPTLLRPSSGEWDVDYLHCPYISYIPAIRLELFLG